MFATVSSRNMTKVKNPISRTVVKDSSSSSLLPVMFSLSKPINTIYTQQKTITSIKTHEVCPLGEGAFAQVFKRTHGTETWAVKCIRNEDTEGLNYGGIRECDVIQRIPSPFMVPTKAITLEHEQLCIHMAEARCNLLEFIPQQTQEERGGLTFSLMWSLLNALRHLHTHQVLHRDLKPENVLVFQPTSTSIPKFYLADYNSCRWHHRHKTLTGGMGTLKYRPPEMELTTYQASSDIYMLAATTVHWLHGHEHAYFKSDKGMTPEQWQELLDECAAVIRPPVLLTILKQLLMRDVQQRWSVLHCLKLMSEQTGLSIPPLVACVINQPPTTDRMLERGITLKMRDYVTDIMMGLCQRFKYAPATLALGLMLWDDYLALVEPTPTAEQLEQVIYLITWAFTALWLAIKYSEPTLCSLKDLLHEARQYYKQKGLKTTHFIEMEMHMLQVLQYRIMRRPLPETICHARKRVIRDDFVHAAQCVKWL